MKTDFLRHGEEALVALMYDNDFLAESKFSRCSYVQVQINFHEFIKLHELNPRQKINNKKKDIEFTDAHDP